MATGRSIIQLKGSLGDWVVYQLNGKTVVRAKSQTVSDTIRKSDTCAEQRTRTEYLKMANAFATAIYRMVKAHAEKLDYKSHNALVKYIYPFVQLKYNNDNSVNELSKFIKVISFNQNETLMPVTISLFQGDIIVNADYKITSPIAVKLLLGTLPKVMSVKGELKTAMDMEEVEVLELTLNPVDHLKTFQIPVNLQSDQIVVALVQSQVKGRHKEWIKVVA